MTSPTTPSNDGRALPHQTTLASGFKSYRRAAFAERDELFEDHGGRPTAATVFKREVLHYNVLVPPDCAQPTADAIRNSIPRTKRHRWFGSMKSSQALAQSVFGSLAAKGPDPGSISPLRGLCEVPDGAGPSVR